MKNWSIKFKLVLLSSSLLFTMLGLGVLSLYIEEKLTERIADVVNNDIPAIRSMSNADMMHDGLRAVVFRALYTSSLNDSEQNKEVAEELKEFSESLTKSIDSISNLDITPDTKLAVQESRPEIDNYLKAAEEIVGLALSGQRELAVKKIVTFQAAFKSLEEKLAKLGDLIEKNTEDDKVAGEKQAQFSKDLTLAILSLGILFGSLLAFLIIRGLIKTLGSVIEQLKNSSDRVSGSSSESAASATTLSEAATEQAASLQETMASVEEISAMVSQNADSAGKVKGAVEANQKVSEEGSKSVGDMLHAIQEIKETNDKILNQMESSNKEFGEIVKIISEIGDKTKVINDIVFQTKLLSFNASVEAARAGEHGKGFAVVAEEVGNLAQMSGNAAKQITDMLSDSIKRVNEIVEHTRRQVDQLVEVGKDKISMGQSTAEKCRESLDKIAENARTVTSMVTEITHASKEQAQGIQEINKAIGQLDQVTQQNSAVAQSSSAQAEQLNSEAGALSHAVLDLATFVNGQSDNVPAGKPEPKQYAERPTATVTDLKPKIKRKSTTMGKAPVRAVNASDVPSSDDPSFEEF